jgi:hypothetical protein
VRFSAAIVPKPQWLGAGSSIRKLPSCFGLLALCLGGENAFEVKVQADSDEVPGVVINHSAASSGTYIGSPSIAIWTNGEYVASHDFFGPGTSNDRTAVFRSGDRGKRWNKLIELEGQWWSTLFAHRGALYLLGTSKENGDVVIRRSLDGGRSWTRPTSSATGLLRHDDQYHGAPTPVLEYRGRLWRGIERRDPTGWGVSLQAGVLSAPVGADLLEASGWTFTNFLPGDTNWLGGAFGGWLEGNVVAKPDGQILDILRVDTPGLPEKVAFVKVSDDARLATFDPRRGFVDFPGGAKKFSIHYDSKSKQYWSLASVDRQILDSKASWRRPTAVRNTLALTCSSNLFEWTVRCTLLHHEDPVAHGFQYVDWLFEGEDIIAVCRTAYDDKEGGAHNYHDANFLTFHRFANFRAMRIQFPASGADLR